MPLDQTETTEIHTISIGKRLRQLNRDTVEALKQSIFSIGLRTPISVRYISDEVGFELIAGLHRLTACRELGWEEVPIREEEGTETDAKMWEIAENLHRADLTVTERSEHIAEWIRLAEERDKLVQLAPVSEKGGRGHKGGMRAAERDLRIEHTEAVRAVKIDALAPEAKAEARALKLDDNQSALLEAAKHETPDAQVQALRDKAAAKAEAKARPKPARKPTAESREPAAQARSKAISGLCRILHQQPTETLADLMRILRDERSRIAQITRPKRLELARGYLSVLGISVDDLQPGADGAGHARP